MPLESTHSFPVRNYDLDATLDSGQAFRWRRDGKAWSGVIGRYWVRLRGDEFGIYAESAQAVRDWAWLTEYLQLNVDLESALAVFPRDQPILSAVAACRGLRLLRQDLWECLASFILSSTKQIVQIQQIVAALCERYGEAIPTAGVAKAYTFPSASRIASIPESELRGCRMGFRAPYLRTTAALVSSGQFQLETLREVPMEIARETLMQLPGVGRKIADCVLLFGYGFPRAFPVDVWVLKGLRELYFKGRKVRVPRLQKFAETHFGDQAGYAQQYLFHYMRKHSDAIGMRKRRQKR